MHEFSWSETISIWAGTFNLNGKGSGVGEDLSAWLCPPVGRQRRDPDIIAAGFQEIVELSPQQVMSTDPVRRQGWEEAVRSTINSKTRYPLREEYVLLRSGQLVGAALFVFVKLSSLKKIKNVEGSVKKTGMSGMAGNKGAVAIRMDYANTRICLVTAHLAAGFANYEERNRDFRTISQGLRFQRNRTIDDHDAIIWLGDMNYRIGLSDDKVRRLIKMSDLESLYANDQMIAGRAFPFYSEARITFLPTYKYNNGTDEYDTSEKSRIPAWCDRILRKGSILKQIDYASAPLRFSDHRPVYATFECTVSNIDESRKEALSRALYEKRKHDLAKPDANGEKTDEDLAGYDSIAAGLPPASSDRRKWWLDNGLPARSQVRPPQDNIALNPKRPSNPFSPTSEPDWVMVGWSQEGRDSESRKNTPPLPPARRGTQATRSPDGHTDACTSAKALSTNSGVASSRAPTSSSSSLTASDLRRKPAPPVPKKPALLSTLSAGTDSPRRNSTVDSSIPSSAIPATDSRPNVAAIPQSPSRRIGPGTTTPSAELDLRSSTLSAKPTSVSQRQKTPSAEQSAGIPPGKGRGGGHGRRNLLDDDDEGARLIPALQPSRPG
ncbi:MAG: hypothetical protein Q9207_008078 [Kuettlingeria erythrocarpa]